MELKRLSHFVAVADAGTVTGAGLGLHISQPALSRQIHELEAELGVHLFDRVGRRMVLTDHGRDLLERSRALLLEARALQEQARTLKEGNVGTLRVGASPQTLESLVPNFLVRYRKERPGVDIQLAEEGGAHLVRMVERGEIHLALAPGTDGEHLGVRPLFPVRLLAVMPASHRLRRQATLAIADLAVEPLLLLRQGFGSRQWFDRACQAAGFHPQLRLESGAPHSLVALARAGYGIAVIPSNVQFTRDGVRVATIVHGNRALGAWLSVFWDQRRLLPRHAESFISELAAHTRRSYPGRDFGPAPAVPRPGDAPASATRPPRPAKGARV